MPKEEGDCGLSKDDCLNSIQENTDLNSEEATAYVFKCRECVCEDC